MKLKPHDEITEWSVCGNCLKTINYAASEMESRESDDTNCPFCGSKDTAWLHDEDAEMGR